MKLRAALLILFAVTLLQPTSAAAENYVGFGCAPWDGRTFSLIIDREGSSLSVNIWQKGLGNLESGQRSIAIDNRGAGGDVPDATGSAVLRSGSDKPYENVKATVYFTRLDLHVGGDAAGYVQLLDGTKFLFEGKIPAAPRCG